MMSRFVLPAGLVVVILGLEVGLRGSAQAPQTTSPAQAALLSAQQQNKYLFILFWKENGPATHAVKQALDAALARRGGQAAAVAVNTADAAESAVVAQFGVSRSPMPLVVAVAPNGAITGGFPLKLTEQDVAAAFVSPGTAACLKGTQARKLVLLCVQPSGTRELPIGIRDFKADTQLGPATEIVTIQADDPTEAGLLKALKIAPAATTVTALIIPPGSSLGNFDHTATKQQLVDRLKSAPNTCCPDGKCGPGGCCCPGGKCNPKQ
jgi:hypothetical protein